MTPNQRQHLLQVARASIEHGLSKGMPLHPDHEDPELNRQGASFVTLNRHGELRGCIGSLEPRVALIDDVATNAFNAAFKDPRFPQLTRTELQDLEIHISILSATEPMHFSSEADLLRQLRPGIDGLVMQEGHRRGTCLPQVWESLPDPVDFLNHLKRKAGLPAHYWSPTLQVERYSVESIP